MAYIWRHLSLIPTFSIDSKGFSAGVGSLCLFLGLVFLGLILGAIIWTNIVIKMNEQNTISFEQGWELMQKGITKLKNILEGLPELNFSSEEYMIYYGMGYNICIQKAPNYCQQLYDKYRETFEEYITSTVIPSLREKHDEFMLRELVRRWSNHKVMVLWLSRFFHYLDRYYIVRSYLLPLNEVGCVCFHEQVYPLLVGGVEWKQSLNRRVEVQQYVIGKVGEAVLSMVDECLKREKNMASDYLHSSYVPAVLEIVERELLSVDATKLLEKDDTYWLTLLTNDKVEDLSRVYKLCSKMPAVVDHASSMFKQHVTSEGRKLVNQVFVRKVIELYDKYLSYVNDCFINHTLFRKALDEACEIICNMAIAGSSIAELLATFCDNTLKKGGSQKLSDDAIEDTLEKVVKLLAYNNDKDRFAEFYRKKLAWRLLFDMSADDEHERSILTKLK
ncbi:hypothetical protein L2E82_51143 [Cichorium intybus]|nr:hypothetical protein L2E82_51143 [Cichorium intybus]